MTGMSLIRGISTVPNEKLLSDELLPFSPVHISSTKTVKPLANVFIAVPQRTEFAFITRWKYAKTALRMSPIAMPQMNPPKRLFV